MLCGAPGDCWPRVLGPRREARARRRGEARSQAGGPHRVGADRPLQGMQVRATLIRRKIKESRRGGLKSQYKYLRCFLNMFPLLRYCASGNYQMCVPHHVYGFHQVSMNPIL